MSIANELSSEVAAAMLARERYKEFDNPIELLNVVLEVHTTLSRMTNESRRKSFKSLSDPSSPRGAAAVSNY